MPAPVPYLFAGFEGAGKSSFCQAYLRHLIPAPWSFLVAGVGGVAINLEEAPPGAKGCAEGFFEVTTATSVLPTVADAVAATRAVEDPTV